MPSGKKPKYLDEAYQMVLDDLLKTFIQKNKDYGKDNILDTGELGIVFRVNDKVRRLQNLLMSGKKPKNEPINDTWLDIAVYAVIAILYRKGQFQELNLDPKS